jgi:hypothetical protein
MDDQRANQAGGGSVTLPRFSLRRLFFVTTLIGIYAAILNNPFGPIARALTAQVCAMILLAFSILAWRDYIRFRDTMSPTAWVVSTVSAMLFVWALCQWAAVLLFADQK